MWKNLSLLIILGPWNAMLVKFKQTYSFYCFSPTCRVKVLLLIPPISHFYSAAYVIYMELEDGAGRMTFSWKRLGS